MVLNSAKIPLDLNDLNYFLLDLYRYLWHGAQLFLFYRGQF